MIHATRADRISDMPKKPTPFNKAVGSRLAAIRELAGSNMREFAAVLDVEEDRYRSWEKGINGLPPEKADELCERFDLTYDWLYRGRTAGLPVQRARELAKAQSQRKAA